MVLSKDPDLRESTASARLLIRERVKAAAVNNTTRLGTVASELADR